MDLSAHTCTSPTRASCNPKFRRHDTQFTALQDFKSSNTEDTEKKKDVENFNAERCAFLSVSSVSSVVK
jgi:hypothetical protein